MIRRHISFAVVVAAVALPSLPAAPAAFPPVVMSASWPAALDSHPEVAPDSRFTPAPVPDLDLLPPSARDQQPSHAELSPKIYGSRLPRTHLGDGYTPGSTVDDEVSKPQRLQQLAPGLALSVPLQ